MSSSRVRVTGRALLALAGFDALQGACPDTAELGELTDRQAAAGSFGSDQAAEARPAVLRVRGHWRSVEPC
jgi:hypothetical protein